MRAYASFYTLNKQRHFAPPFCAYTACDRQWNFSSTTEHLLLPTATDLTLCTHEFVPRVSGVPENFVSFFVDTEENGQPRRSGGSRRVLCRFTLLRIPKDRDTIFSTSRVLIEVRRSEDPFSNVYDPGGRFSNRSHTDTRDLSPENNANTQKEREIDTHTHIHTNTDAYKHKQTRVHTHTDVDLYVTVILSTVRAVQSNGTNNSNGNDILLTIYVFWD